MLSLKVNLSPEREGLHFVTRRVKRQLLFNGVSSNHYLYLFKDIIIRFIVWMEMSCFRESTPFFYPEVFL